MRTQLPNSDLFVKNREKLARLLPNGSAALLTSNSVLYGNGDSILGFKQNSDLFYLCGIIHAETSLFICPTHSNESIREVLFIKEITERTKVWDGPSLDKEEAENISGIKTIYYQNEFFDFLKNQIPSLKSIFFGFNEQKPANTHTPNHKLFHQISEWFPLHNFERLSPLIAQLRLIKEEQEIQYIQKAISFSHGALLAACKSLRAGMKEYELEAELTHYFIKNGCDGHAFLPIVAAAENACYLHYTQNKATIPRDSLVLMDFGACYGMYNADITRCIPVSGRFSARQKQVYQTVLDTFKFSKSLLKPGALLKEIKAETKNYMQGKFKSIGLNPEEVDRYFPHGVNHHLGLDVHDVGDRSLPIKEGMVLTCEPGIYIPEEKLGIRIENDILITSYGNRDLCEGIPLEVEEIEALF